MEAKEPTFSYNYKPGRTVEELEYERLIGNLKLTYTERFRRMTALIRLSRNLKQTKKANSDGHFG
jgi:hypothetical protein